MVTFGSRLNRSYSLYFPFLGEYITVTVFFSKANSSLAFKTTPRYNEQDRDSKLVVSTYKDLKQSIFSSTFLDIKDFKSENLDIRSQFSNILPDFKEKIQYVSNESIKLSKVQTDNGTFENLLFLYAFTFNDYVDDFLYLLAERQHIDTILNKKIVRTSAIQISTPDCQQMILKLAEKFRGTTLSDFEKRDIIQDEAILNDLFPDNHHPRRITKL